MASTPKAKGRPRSDVGEGLTPKIRRTSIAALPAKKEDTLPQRLERALAALRPDGYVGKLPCREDEQQRISTHLQTAVRCGGSQQVLYISGMPGTGKTASVLDAIQQMRHMSSIPAFSLAHVNAMRLGTPGGVFRDILNQLGTSRCSAATAHTELAQYFSDRSASHPLVLLLVDEIDHLVTANQAVLYKLFDWLSLPSPKLVIVAISNTMDLPERLLPRVASRFGIVRVDFEPYNRDQICKILNERLTSHDALACFSPTVLKLCSARVAAGTGDIRKALQVCKRAAEVRMAMHKEEGQVELKHLTAAEQDLLHANPATRAMGGLGIRARRFLLALLLEMKKQEVDAIPLSAVASHYAKLLAALERDALGVPVTMLRESGQWHPMDEAAHLSQRLVSMALLREQTPGANSRSAGPLLLLGGSLDTEDLASALKTGEEDEGILELLHDAVR